MINKKNLIRRFSLTLYFLAAFLVFLLLLFPFDRVKTALQSRVSRTTPVELSIGRIAPRFFNSFRLTDVVISDKKGQVLFESPNVGTSISLINLISKMLVLDVNARAYSGDLSIKVKSGGSQQQFFLDAKGIDIGSYSLLKDKGLRVTGTLGGTVEFTGRSGTGKLQAKGLGWRDLEVKGVSVPDVNFETGLLEADVKGDRLSVKKLELSGKELNVRCEGEVILRERGMVNLTVKLKPSGRLEREQAGLLSLLKNKGSDGYYQIVIGGTLNNPLPRL